MGIRFNAEFSIMKDPWILDGLKNLPKPFVSNQTNYQKAKRFPHVDMDKITIKQAMYVSIKDTENPDDAMAVIPFEFDL